MGIPEKTYDPVLYKYGAVYEKVTDISLAGPGMNWSLSRSYANGGANFGGATTQGNKWLNSVTDKWLFWNMNTNIINVYLDSTTERTFTQSGSTWVGPSDGYSVLAYDSANSQFVFTDKLNNLRWTFIDYSNPDTKTEGAIKEESTLQLFAQGKSGYVYTLTSGGLPSQITTPTGQDYNIIFTYDSNLYLTQVQLKDASGNLLQQVDYTYYQGVTSPSTDLGTTGDLVQVKVSKKATTDTGSTLSIVRYTQYRYSGTSSNVKAVYEHDAIQRVLASTGLSSPTDILSHADTYGTPAIQTFASRSFTYYTSDASTTSINTPFSAGENLQSRYGGSNLNETGYVKTETIGGCGGCGTAGSVTKNYFYMSLANTTTDQNQVVTLTIEDTQDSAGTAVYRKVVGLDGAGRMLRKTFIQNPTGSPTYWCDSWTFATSTGSTALPFRIAEHRHPSAHTGVTTSTALQNFLNPYNGTSWSNDTGTVNASSGLIETYSYNSTGLMTDAFVKNGESSTAYYVSATDYGDSINPAIATATYDYPTQTTTRSSGVETTYSYTFYDSTTHQQVKTKTTSLPTISTTQNGSGVATTKSEYYDNLGRLRWTQDGEGYIDYYAYHPVMGKLAYQAVDVDPSSVSSDISSGSSGNWEDWTVDGANSNKPTRSSSLPSPLALATKTYFDVLGRQTQLADCGGASHYTAYGNLQTIRFPYWNSGTGQSLLPIQVTNLNNAAQVSDRIDVRATYTAISTSGGAPTGFSTTPSQSDYVTWIHYTYDSNTGWLTYTDRYSSVPSSGAGTLSTNYYRKVRQYDTLGRKQYDIQVIRGSAHNNRVEQVTQYSYDVRDRVVQINKGVSGDSAANSQDMTDNYNSYPTLYAISQNVYDNGGVGDGYVTKTRKFFGTSSTSYTGTNCYRTYRGHSRGLEPFYVNGTTETPMGPYIVDDIDWKGRTTTAAQYSADPTWSSVLTGDGYSAYGSSATTNRLTRMDNLFDDLGRVYQTKQYEISASSGTGSNYVAHENYYDRNNKQAASANDYAAGLEVAYDGAGRVYEIRKVVALQSSLYSSGVFQYCAPTPIPSLGSMSGGDGGVLHLWHRAPDANGNATEVHTLEDDHDDLGGSNPGINLTTNTDYVRQTVYSWYNSAGRLIATADYGSGDPASGAGQWKYTTLPTRSSTAPSASSNTALVTLYGYNTASGLQEEVTDAAGTITKTFFDNLNRKTYVAENWNDFSPPSTGTGDSTDHSMDHVTIYVYDGPDRPQQIVALDPNGTGTVTNNQVTTYLYEDVVDANRRTSEIYPDSSDTTSSGTNQIKVAYNVDGSPSQRSDQRGTVIGYTYTNARFLGTASVGTLGTGVDGAVRSMKRTYDNLNRLQNITSYDGTGGTGTVLNDIQYAYNDFGQRTASYQSHSGAVNTSSTPSVQYTFDTTTTSAVFSSQHRLQTVVYPNGRTVFYGYNASSSSDPYHRLSKVREIRDTNSTGTQLAVYDYNGALSRLAIVGYPQPAFKLDYFQGTSGTYAGLDRFGRVVDQYWKGYGGTPDVDRIHYAYSYAGNRIYRDIDAAIYPTNDRDQAYTYDGLHRLLTSQQGTLSGTTIGGTPVNEEDWTLDGIGNWPEYVTKSSGTTNLDQTRAFSASNEISAISAAVGATWATPAYDLAGNMTSIPIPSSPTSTYTATYDAWNRLVSLASGSTTVATYAYDGLNRRVVKGIYTAGSLDHKEHAYYNEDWQVLEVRKEVSGTIVGNPLEQCIWHPVYIDAPVLRDYDAATSGSPTRYYYAFDGTYNVTACTSAGGTLIERYHYSPYGTVTFLDAAFTPIAASTIGESVTYSGRQYDAESGLYCFRHRYLSAMLGLFLTRDPLGYEDGTSLYRPYFVPDSTDPLGLADQADSKRCHSKLVNSNMKRVSRKVQDMGWLTGWEVWFMGQVASVTDSSWSAYAMASGIQAGVFSHSSYNTIWLSTGKVVCEIDQKCCSKDSDCKIDAKGKRIPLIDDAPTVDAQVVPMIFIVNNRMTIEFMFVGSKTLGGSYAFIESMGVANWECTCGN